MKSDSPGALILAFTVALMSVGIPYWIIPYNQVNLPSALLAPGLLVVAIAALLLCMCRVASFWKTTLVMASSPAAVVMLRVLVDATRDPTSHNLWPLEVVIAMIVGVATALPGAVLGLFINKVLERRDSERTS
jgi:hypothetical protein